MLSRLQRMIALTMVVGLLAVLLAACGGNTGGTDTGTGTGASPAAGTGGDAAASPAAGGGTEASPAGGGDAAASPAASAGGDAGASPAGGAAGATACPDTAQGQQINFWNGWSGPDGKFAQTLVDQFNSANAQGIQVKMTVQPFTQYYDKLNAAAASGSLPEIAQIHLDNVATQAARGTIRPVPQEVQDIIGVSGDDFPEAVWAAGEYKGERYSIPIDIHPLVMFYNQEMLSAAGINAAPTNKDEFEKAVQGMTKDGNMGWAVTTGFPLMQMFQTLLHQYGGTEFNAEGTEATWNSEAGVQALTYLKEMQGKVSKPNLPVDAGVSAFKQGTSGMEWNGIWQTTNLTGEGAQFGAAAPIPQIGDQGAVWAGSHQFALTKQSNPDPAKDAAAGCFMAYFLQNSVEWAKGGQIPALNSVRESDAFKAVEPQATIAPSAEVAFFPPPVPGITETFGGALEPAVVDIMTGKQTDVKAALDSAANKAKQILEQNAKRYGGQ